MKVLSFFMALFCATAALAKQDAGLFNQAVRESIQEDMKKDGESYRPHAGRAPASVGPVQVDTYHTEHKNLDKVEKNYKQLGRPSW